jgi:hypothetical protein
VCQAAVPQHPLLRIVPRCMPSRLKCEQAAVVVVDIGLFGRFRNLIQHAIQNE